MTGARALGWLLAQFLLRPQGASAQSESVSEASSGACGEDTAGSNLLQSKAQQQRAHMFEPACGAKGDDSSQLIVNGQDATKCEWKWQVQLNSGSGGNGFSFCGGSLIGEKWVLTAAHCTRGRSPGDFTVIVGDYDKDSQTEVVSQWRAVTQIIDHPDYDDSATRNDLSLLELESAVTLDDCTGTVCLPGPSEELKGGEVCFITGWGTLQAGGSMPSILQEAKVTIVSNEECGNKYGGGRITDDMLCAQGRNNENEVTDACQGDSGGPLVCEIGEGHWVLQGATSWGFGCADEAYPGVWARVHLFREWVQEMMNRVPTPAPIPTTPAPCSETCGDRTFLLTLKTDNFPLETTWELKDANGDTVAHGGPYAGATTEYEHTECIGSGAYTFNISDSYGDGQCCGEGEGGYSVAVTRDEFFKEGGQYEDDEVTDIPECVTPGPEEPTPATEMPTPAPEQPTPAPTGGPPGLPGAPGNQGPPGPPGLAGPPGIPR